MPRTLSEILIDANSTLDLEASSPSGDELSLRQNYANQAVWDAATTGQLNELTNEYIANTSTLSTISLPANFYELHENPMVLDSSGNWVEYEEIEPKAKYARSTADRYCYLLGNSSGGYNLIFNQLISMATLSVMYQRYPSGLLTLSDICELSDPTYVTRKIESYVLYSRSDERFPTAEARAEQRLQNMYGREMKTPGGRSRDTKAKFKNPLG